jgi:uncharacterized protein YegL
MNNEQRRKRIENIVKGIGLVVVGLIVAPTIFIAIKGLIGLALAAAISFVIIKFIPVWGLMVANARLKALKAEASRNPVETLMNDWMRQNEKVESFRHSVVTFRGKISVFEDKLRKFKHQEEKAHFQNILNKMLQLLGLRERALATAQKALVDYKAEIAKQGDLWEMGQAAEDMAAFAGMSEEDVLAEIQKGAAFSAITNKLSESIAELDQSLLDEQNLQVAGHEPAQLGEGQRSTIIDIQTERVLEPVRR